MAVAAPFVAPGRKEAGRPGGFATTPALIKKGRPINMSGISGCYDPLEFGKNRASLLVVDDYFDNTIKMTLFEIGCVITA